jgi:hypothetical protein
MHISRLLFCSILVTALSLGTGCSDDTDTQTCPDSGTCSAKDGSSTTCQEAGTCTKDCGVCGDGKICADVGVTPDKTITVDTAVKLDTGTTVDQLVKMDTGTTQADQGTPSIPAEKVLYVTGSSTTALTAYTVKTDGTGKTAVTTLPATFDIESIYNYASPREYSNVTRNIPQEMVHVYSTWKYILLPNQLGQLYHYDTSTDRGFMLIKADGTAKILDKMAGSSYTASYYYYIGVKPDGTMFAASYAYSSTVNAGIKLIRTDGKNFGTTSSGVCDISPTANKMYYPEYESYRYSANHFWFIAREAGNSSQYNLYRAPLDCSAKATKVTMPTVGGAAPKYMHDLVRMSDDTTKYILLTGSSSTNTDVIMVDTTTGTATNLSDSPSDYEEPGYYVMYYATNSHKVGVSPKNTYVAWVDYVSADDELYVRKADKSAAAVHITGSANFATSVDDVHGVQWINDDLLYFWAGYSTTYQDLYSYVPSTNTLTAITTYGGKTAPYAGFTSSTNGYKSPRYGWYSPNGKYIYYTEYDYGAFGPSTYDIIGIERATGKRINITKGLYVTYSSNIEAAETGSNVFFFAYNAGASSTENLYYFDQDKATVAVKLSNFKPSSYYAYIDDIFPSSDGKTVAYNAGPSGQQSLYVTEVKATPVIHKIDSHVPTAGIKQYVADQKVMTTDGKAIVYGTSPTSSSSAFKLQVKSIYGGAAKVLDSTGSYTHVMAVYK